MSNQREAAQSALNARDFAAANVHALLYLADEQRLANLIALSNPEHAASELVDYGAIARMIREFLEGAQ